MACGFDVSAAAAVATKMTAASRLFTSKTSLSPGLYITFIVIRISIATLRLIVYVRYAALLFIIHCYLFGPLYIVLAPKLTGLSGWCVASSICTQTHTHITYGTITFFSKSYLLFIHIVIFGNKNMDLLCHYIAAQQANFRWKNEISCNLIFGGGERGMCTLLPSLLYIIELLSRCE